MRAKSLKAGIILLLAGLLLTWLVSDGGQSALQRLKYGKPVTFCLDDVRVTLMHDWQIALLRPLKSTWPLVGGILPIPSLTIANDNTLAQVSLKSPTRTGEISISRIKESISREDLISSCKTSDHCERAASKFDSGSDVVRITNSPTIWIRYLDKPVMIGLHGVTDEVDKVLIGACEIED